MKQGYINILAVCMTLMIAAACGKEQPQPSKPEPEAEALEELTIKAEVATKTVLNTDNTVDWSVGDAVSVFSINKSGGNNRFDSSHSSVVHETDLYGKIESGTTEVLALYPYTASAAYSGGTVTGMSIPTTQTATETSFANGASVTIAKGTKAASAKTVVLLFKNLCSVLRFTVPEGIKESSSITIESINNNVKMSGAVSIDSSTESITSAATPSVVLSGSFTGGKTYCVTVAPGNYDQGFRFTITGTNGTTLVREAPAVNAKKGEVYNIGVLNPVISGDPVTCSITHTYENSTLTGSNATVTLSAPQDEFASNIKGWRLDNVTIKSQDGTVLYRTLGSTSSTSGQALTLSQASGKPYIPHGSYTLSADIYYTVKKADGTLAEKLFQQNFTKTVTSPTPDAITLTQSNITGYTSYSCYKGTDGQSASATTANGKDNDKIYDIGFTYKGMLSDAVYAQCSGLLSSSTTLDGSAKSGTTTVTDWKKYTIACTATFDGVTKSASKDVHITGLPYSAVPPKKSGSPGGHNWTDPQGRITWNTDHVYMIYAAAQYPYITSPNFHIPADINVSANGRIVVYTGGGSHTLNIKCGGTDHKYKDRGSKKGDTWTDTVNETMTSSKNNWTIMYEYAFTGPETYVYSFYVKYR